MSIFCRSPSSITIMYKPQLCCMPFLSNYLVGINVPVTVSVTVLAEIPTFPKSVNKEDSECSDKQALETKDKQLSARERKREIETKWGTKDKQLSARERKREIERKFGSQSYRNLHTHIPSENINDDDDTIIQNINKIINNHSSNCLTSEDDDDDEDDDEDDDDDEEFDPQDIEFQALKQIIARSDDKKDTNNAYWDEEERDFDNIDTSRLSFEGLLNSDADDKNNNKNKQLQLQQGDGQYSNNKTQNNNDGVDESFIPPRYDTITPFTEYHGPMREDFIKAMHYHPTKFASYGRNNLHRDSRCEPVPDFPKNRTNPPLSFVENDIRFIFVTGLPPPIQQQQEEKDGTETEVEAGKKNHKSNNTDPGMNKLRIHDKKAKISDLFNVPSSQVFPANENSAFIGFDNPKEFNARFFEPGPKKPSIIPPVSISEYSSNNQNNNAIAQVRVDDIPKGFSPSSIKINCLPKIVLCILNLVVQYLLKILIYNHIQRH